MAFLSKLLWQNGFLLSSLNSHSQLQLPRFITHSTLTPGILLKMNFLQLAALSSISGCVPIALLYLIQNHDTAKTQTLQNFRFDAIDTRLDAMNTHFDTRLGRLERDVKNLSAQTMDCTADCADAKRALLSYGRLPRRLNTVEKKFGGQNGLVDPAKNRNVNEKITDGAHNLFEKATGKNVPEKLLN